MIREQFFLGTYPPFLGTYPQNGVEGLAAAKDQQKACSYSQKKWVLCA
jgi:hypothetical protein